MTCIFYCNRDTHVFVRSVAVVKGSVPLSGRQAARSGGHILTVGVSLWPANKCQSGLEQNVHYRTFNLSKHRKDSVHMCMYLIQKQLFMRHWCLQYKTLNSWGCSSNEIKIYANIVYSKSISLFYIKIIWIYFIIYLF